MKVLVIDVGGTNVKLFANGEADVRKFPSGPTLTAKLMVDGVLQLVSDWTYDVITIGYPGPVIHGRLALEPRNLRIRLGRF